MPYSALHADTGDICFAATADPDGDYVCIKCEAGVTHIDSHSRQLPNGGQTTVRSYFMYKNCGHAGKKQVNEQCGGGGGDGNSSGGGGEDPIHKIRKWDALGEALRRFSDSHHQVEATIGNKRADALLEFEQPHEEYGKGLVIEYQNKNEGKDIEATEKHFARNQYTTVWLWDEQFSYESHIPDIELFGGKVYTPWPDAVPPNEDWTGIGFAQEKQLEWAKAHGRGLTNSTVKANIPLLEWLNQCDMVVGVSPRLEFEKHVTPSVPLVVNDVSNGLVYTTVNVDDIPDIHEGNPVKPIYDGDIAVSDVDYYAPAELWWRESPWHEKFRGTLELPIGDNSDGEPTKPTTSPPFAEWLRSGDDPQGIIRILKRAHVNGEHDIDESRKDRNMARKRVKRIIEHNTGNSQSSTVSDRAVRTIGSHSNVPNTLIRWAIGQLHADGEIEEPQRDRYRLPHSTRRQ